MPQNQRFFITVDDLSAARGETGVAFDGVSPEYLASTLQDALRETTLWERWRATRDDPDEVDPASGAVDPAAIVTATLSNLRAEVRVTTSLPHAILRHRLDLLIGKSWKLRDVSSV